MGTAIRWILTPIASVAAWYAAVVLGALLFAIAQSFCPADEQISGMCVAPWFPAVEAGVFCVSTALSAVFVVTAAFLVAPEAKGVVAWLAFGIGSIVALLFAIGTSDWGMLATAEVAGLLTAWALSKPQARTPSAKPKIDDELA